MVTVDNNWSWPHMSRLERDIRRMAFVALLIASGVGALVGLVVGKILTRQTD